MSDVIQTAYNQYAQRPADECFTSLSAMVESAAADRALSVERAYNLKDLRAVAVGDGLQLASPKGQANFTHWSFGQTCRMLGAPAAFLRDGLSPEIAAAVLNYRLQGSAPGATANLLVKQNGGEPVVRAATSDSYGRCWDTDLYHHVASSITRHDDQWKLPTAWSGDPAGAYRGDRDSFLILVNGGSIVEDPSAREGHGDMYRGVMLRNSEVGASSVVIETVLFRFICGNLMLWGAMYDSRFRRRHVGQRVTRDVVREVTRIALNWTQQSTRRDDALIAGLIAAEVASSRAAVVDELQKAGATKEQAGAAYDRCEQEEPIASPRSYWGLAQGLTRLSQDTPYQDARYALDRVASNLLVKGRKLVAA